MLCYVSFEESYFPFLQMVSVVNDTIVADNVMVNILNVHQNQGELVVIYEVILASVNVSLSSFLDYFSTFIVFESYRVSGGGPFGIIGMSPSGKLSRLPCNIQCCCGVIPLVASNRLEATPPPVVWHRS